MTGAIRDPGNPEVPHEAELSAENPGLRREVGGFWEDRAREFLEGKGYQLADRNWRSRLGEIDLVFWDGNTLVFVEVRYRRKGSLVEAAVSLTGTKLRRLRGSISAYIASKGLPMDTPWRLDAVLVDGEDMQLLENITS